MRAASCASSVQTIDERRPVSGRIANGPAGRKCTSSRIIALSAPASAVEDTAESEHKPAMSTPIQDLLNVLDLERLEVNLFRGHSPPTDRTRVYGGQGVGPAPGAA